MRLQDVWAGEAAGLQQCSADSLSIHRRPLQCRAIRRLGVGRAHCCPPIASHYGAERLNRSVLRDVCEQHDRTNVEPYGVQIGQPKDIFNLWLNVVSDIRHHTLAQRGNLQSTAQVYMNV
jgi:hypothetical protein